MTDCSEMKNEKSKVQNAEYKISDQDALLNVLHFDS